VPDRDGPDCPHGYPSWRRTRQGEHVCPICRRTVAAARTRTPAPPRQQTFSLADLVEQVDERRPVVEAPVAPVIPISRRRRR
jgi:hypothetical protein